ncbi:MAG: hypothetical protein ABI076_00880 [Acidobacteriaceae bacterium]
MNFSGVEKIAAAILYEGYILYPYRPSSMKNRQRWNFGTLYPRVYAETQSPQEPFRLVAECIVEAGAGDASLDLKIQFLQLLRQQGNLSASIPCVTRSLTDPSLAWEEATERTSEQQNLRLNDLVEPLTLALQFDDSDLPDGTNLRQLENLQAQLTIGAEPLPSGAHKIHLELQNTSPLRSGKEAKREEVLPRSFVSAHVLMGIHGGQFVSLLDPPGTYQASVASCQNTGVFPVLAGEEPDRSILFCSPIILYDYPKIAPESEGDFFDGTEMDEMLTLRVLTLTDAEKQEMRNGDPRARRILERTESMTAESMMKAHGVIRGMRDIREDLP